MERKHKRQRTDLIKVVHKSDINPITGERYEQTIKPEQLADYTLQGYLPAPVKAAPEKPVVEPKAPPPTPPVEPEKPVAPQAPQGNTPAQPPAPLAAPPAAKPPAAETKKQ